MDSPALLVGFSPLSAEDAAFVERLMRRPAAGLAWAEQTMRSPDAPELALAAACVARSEASWDAQSLRASHAARMVGLAHPRLGARFARELPGVWLQEEARAPSRKEPWGVAAWIEALEQCGDYGVPAELSRALAESAVASAGVQAWLSARPAARLDELFEDSAAARRRAPPPWQVELARKQAPARAARLLLATYFDGSDKGGRLASLSTPGAKELARSALSEPESAHALVRSLLMGKFSGNYYEDDDGLEGIFDALAENPNPTLSDAADPKAPLPKIFGSGKAAVSVAMEMMCRGRLRAGLAAARWAKALGAGGREPVNRRTDGESWRAFQMWVEVYRSQAFNYGSVGVSRMSEPAFLLRAPEVCQALRELGWAWPDKARAKELAEEVSKKALLLDRQKATPAWRGAEAPEDAGAGVLAFWESLALARMVPRAPAEGAAHPPKRAPRI